MIQQLFDFAQQAAPRPKKAAPRRTAQPAPTDPFPSFQKMQATIKELRAEVQQMKKKRAETESLNRAAGNQLARLQKQLADAQKRQSVLSAKNAAQESTIRMYSNMLYEQMAGQAGKVAIPPDMLRRLTMLAHPDRHNSSEASVKATQWLLQQRR